MSDAILAEIEKARSLLCPVLYYVLDDVGCQPGKCWWLKQTDLCPETVVLHSADLAEAKAKLPGRTFVPLSEYLPDTIVSLGTWFDKDTRFKYDFAAGRPSEFEFKFHPTVKY